MPRNLFPRGNDGAEYFMAGHSGIIPGFVTAKFLQNGGFDPRDDLAFAHMPIKLLEELEI